MDEMFRKTKIKKKTNLWIELLRECKEEYDKICTPNKNPLFKINCPIRKIVPVYFPKYKCLEEYKERWKKYYFLYTDG